MPRNVEHQITATQLRPNDVIVGADDKSLVYGSRVVSIDRKVKRAHVTVDLLGVERVVYPLLDAAVTVQREEKTGEEKFAELRATSVEWLTKKLDAQVNDLVVNQLRQMVADWDDRVARDPGYDDWHLLTYWNVDTLLKTQARRRPWAEVGRILTRITNPKEASAWYGRQVDVITAVAMVLREGAERTVRDPLSRSTSVLSNLFEDLDDWAYAKFVEDLKWYVANGVLERENALIDEGLRRDEGREVMGA